MNIKIVQFVLYAVRSVIQFAKVSLHVQALIELRKAQEKKCLQKLAESQAVSILN